jgi:scpA/B protein
MEELVVKVNNFEGPFDLLLNLIEKKKMMISDINISQLIDEYLEVLKLSERENIEIKSDFIIIASELIEIKT